MEALQDFKELKKRKGQLLMENKFIEARIRVKELELEQLRLLEKEREQVRLLEKGLCQEGEEDEEEDDEKRKEEKEVEVKEALREEVKPKKEEPLEVGKSSEPLPRTSVVLPENVIQERNELAKGLRGIAYLCLFNSLCTKVFRDHPNRQGWTLLEEYHLLLNLEEGKRLSEIKDIGLQYKYIDGRCTRTDGFTRPAHEITYHFGVFLDYIRNINHRYTVRDLAQFFSLPEWVVSQVQLMGTEQFCVNYPDRKENPFLA